MYYGPSIILATGIKIGKFEPGDPELGVLLNIPLAFINALGSGVASLFIDRLGRRFIMLRTLPGVLFSCLIVTASFYMSLFGESEQIKMAGNYISMAGLVLYLSFFSVGMSSTVWSVNTEIYPIHLIGIATSIATATNWGSNFVVSSLFLSIMETDTGKVIAFAILGGFTALCFVFVYYLLPETKGRPVLENV